MTQNSQFLTGNDCANTSRHVPILLVDDDIVSIMSIQRGMKAKHAENPILVAHDGEQALEILREWVLRDSILKPVLVVLDINMPKMNGHEFLAEIRNDPMMKHLVVFIRSTSALPIDVSAAFDHNVAGYFSKSESNDSTRVFVELLQHYISANVFPDQVNTN
jgi:CheY-like chemotaxis protein